MYLLFDIGGSRMRISVSGDGFVLHEIRKYSTPDNFDDVFGYFSEFKEYSFEKVAGGLAGVLDREKVKLVRAPNLQRWVGIDIKKKLEDFLGKEVVLENDAALAGLGEACFGAGRSKNIVAYLTMSTGIGGARIVNKKIDACTWGFEPGKQIIDADVTLWPESKAFNPENLPPGSIESYISGAAINYRYGKPPSDIKDPEIWKSVEELVCTVINNTISYWSPEVIILGGGMVLENAVSVDNIKNALEKRLKIFPDLPEIVKAQLKDSSALFGAMSLAGGG